MTKSKGPEHVVVDGSNIATEGRSLPSLAQLQEAVMAFMAEFPDTAVTVVVDATFGHRIDKSEVKEFDEGIANNELVAPPAGAVGRGDAFVLGIADKARATVLSNDSFQEFHGEYGWLFDEGRLIGGKPVPHVGWVFVDRVPVRGPVSRKATASSKGSSKGSKRGSRSRGGRKASKAASEPMPVPSSPPPATAKESSADDAAADQASKERSEAPAGNGGDGGKRPAPKRGEPVNEVLPFLQFVEHHPIGTSVNGTVDAYSSHGAYISIGDDGVRGYIPLRLMSDPPPRSARKQLKIGESVTVVVVSFVPERRSIDCAMPDMAATATTDLDADRPAAVKAEVQEVVEATADAEELEALSSDGSGGDRDASRTRTSTTKKKAAAKKKAPAKKKAAAKKAPTKKKAAAKKKAPAKKKAAAEKAPAEEAPASDESVEQPAPDAAPVEGQASAEKKAPAKKKAAAKKATATKRAATGKSTPRRRSRSAAATSEPSDQDSTDGSADAPTSGDDR